MLKNEMISCDKLELHMTCGRWGLIRNIISVSVFIRLLTERQFREHIA